MSLVSEALRKARQEAAAREAARRGRVVPSGLVEPPRARGGAARGLALGALVIVAGLAGAVGAWLVLGRGSESAPIGHRASPHAEVSAPTPPNPEVLAAGATPAALTAPATSAGEREPVPRPTRQDGAGTPPVVPSAPTPRPSATAPQQPPVDAARVASAPTPTKVDRVFVLDADLGRVRLHLDFVVYKPSAPFAGINGTQVVPGSIVEGLVVEEIGRDFVRLRDGRSAVTLKVR